MKVFSQVQMCTICGTLGVSTICLQTTCAQMLRFLVQVPHVAWDGNWWTLRDGDLRIGCWHQPSKCVTGSLTTWQCHCASKCLAKYRIACQMKKSGTFCTKMHFYFPNCTQQDEFFHSLRKNIFVATPLLYHSTIILHPRAQEILELCPFCIIFKTKIS